MIIKVSHIRFAIAIIFLSSIFGDAYITSVYGLNFKKIAVPVFLGLSMVFWKDMINSSTAIKTIVLVSILLFSISIPFWPTFYNAYAYLGIVVAFVAYSTSKVELLKILRIFTFITVSIAAVEYYTSSYLFVSNVTKLTGEIVSIDEKYSGGAIGVFRSKSFFYSPLSLGLFLISISFIFISDLKIHLVTIIGAFFANARLALVVILIILIWQFLRDKEMNRTNLFVLSGLGLLSFIFLFDFEAIGVSIERFISVIDVSQSNNQARIFYWSSAFNHFLNYDLIGLLFGKNGSYYLEFDNGTESGWLSLLVDNGVLGLVFYLLVLSSIFFNGPLESKVIIILTFTIMLVITYHVSATSNFMYWFIIFLLIDNIYSINKKRYTGQLI